MRMSLLFSAWYLAFLILQSIVRFTRIELPKSLRESIGIELDEAMGIHNSASRNIGKPKNNIPTTARDPNDRENNSRPYRGPNRTEPQEETIYEAEIHPLLTGTNSIPLHRKKEKIEHIVIIDLHSSQLQRILLIREEAISPLDICALPMNSTKIHTEVIDGVGLNPIV